MEITEDRWYLKQYDLESGEMVAEVKIPGALGHPGANQSL